MASEDHGSSREPSPAGGVKPSREAELQALLARVEAATGADRYADCWLACALDGFFPVPKQWPTGFTGQMSWRVDLCCERDGGLVSPGHGGDQMVQPYTASLDAALALLDRVLPGSAWDTARLLHNGRGHANLYADGDAPDDPVQHYAAEAATPPLAVLAALLAALMAEAASPASGTTGVWTNQSPTPLSKTEVQS